MKVRWVPLGLLVVVLLVPALVVTAARELDPAGGGWVRLVAFAPFAAVAYLGALVLLLIAWARGTGRWRRTAGALAVVALLGVVVHVHWSGGPYLGARPKRSASAAPVHVMTSNLRLGQADTARVVELAVQHRIDVLVVEEVTPHALQGLQAAGVGEAFPRSAGEAEPGTHGTMVFSRTPLTNVHRLATGFGSYAMDVELAGVPEAPRGLVHLLAVHPRPPVGDATGWRADQLVIRHAARALQGPTMVVGDLNATMDNEPMRELVGRGYQDAATQAKSRWQPTWPSAGEVSRFGIAVPPVLAIDHVLVDRGLRAVRTESFTVDGTDHRALAAALYP